MRLLVSGATTTIRRLLSSSTYGQLASDHLGHLLTPANGNKLSVLLQTGLPIAVDNAAFSGFDAPAWVALTRSLDQYRLNKWSDALLWVVAPDVVADAEATLDQWIYWRHHLKALHLPPAYVAQDGAEAGRLIPWSRIRCLFIGGSTAWKESTHAESLIRKAKELGKWVHVGRINTMRRLDMFDALGVDSFDGGQFSMFPDRYIPRWLERISHQQRGLWSNAA